MIRILVDVGIYCEQVIVPTFDNSAVEIIAPAFGAGSPVMASGPTLAQIYSETDPAVSFTGTQLATGVVFEGFSVTTNKAGRGILIGAGRKPTIRNNYITCCATNSSSPVLSGGAILVDGMATIEDCVIWDCESVADGGGIAIGESASADISGTRIAECEANGSGGAIAQFGQSTISRCTFQANTCDEDGGALAVLTAKAGAPGTSIFSSRFIANTATSGDSRGGAVYCASGFFEQEPLEFTLIVGNGFLGNEAGDSTGTGGAIYIGSRNSPAVANNTIMHNDVGCDGEAAGVYIGAPYAPPGGSPSAFYDCPSGALGFLHNNLFRENAICIGGTTFFEDQVVDTTVSVLNNQNVSEANVPLFADAGGTFWKTALSGSRDYGIFDFHLMADTTTLAVDGDTCLPSEGFLDIDGDPLISPSGHSPVGADAIYNVRDPQTCTDLPYRHHYLWGGFPLPSNYLMGFTGGVDDMAQGYVSAIPGGPTSGLCSSEFLLGSLFTTTGAVVSLNPSGVWSFFFGQALNTNSSHPLYDRLGYWTQAAIGGGGNFTWADAVLIRTLHDTYDSCTPSCTTCP